VRLGLDFIQVRFLRVVVLYSKAERKIPSNCVDVKKGCDLFLRSISISRRGSVTHDTINPIQMYSHVKLEVSRHATVSWMPFQIFSHMKRWDRDKSLRDHWWSTPSLEGESCTFTQKQGLSLYSRLCHSAQTHRGSYDTVSALRRSSSLFIEGHCFEICWESTIFPRKKEQNRRLAWSSSLIGLFYVRRIFWREKR